MDQGIRELMQAENPRCVGFFHLACFVAGHQEIITKTTLSPHQLMNPNEIPLRRAATIWTANFLSRHVKALFLKGYKNGKSRG